MPGLKLVNLLFTKIQKFGMTFAKKGHAECQNFAGTEMNQHSGEHLNDTKCTCTSNTPNPHPKSLAIWTVKILHQCMNRYISNTLPISQLDAPIFLILIAHSSVPQTNISLIRNQSTPIISLFPAFSTINNIK